MRTEFHHASLGGLYASGESPKDSFADVAQSVNPRALASLLKTDRSSAFRRAGAAENAIADARKVEDTAIRKETLDAHLLPSPFSGATSPPTNIKLAEVGLLSELLASIQELLLRQPESPETVLNVGPLQLDLLSRTVTRGGRKIDLRSRELRLLEYMMRHKGQVLTRAVFFKEVWNYKFVPSSNLVDVHMGRLRRNIDQADEVPMIYSIRGQGFMLRGPT